MYTEHWGFQHVYQLVRYMTRCLRNASTDVTSPALPVITMQCTLICVPPLSRSGPTSQGPLERLIVFFAEREATTAEILDEVIWECVN